MPRDAPRPSLVTSRLASLLDDVAGSHRRAVLGLTVVSLVALLPGFFTIPPVDRDEALFAQSTKQMIETGNYVDIRFQGRTLYKKPIGINWLQAGVVQTAVALGIPGALRTIWLYRIPSLLGALGAVLLTYWAGLAFDPRRAAWLAALMLATSIMLGVQGRLARTDAVLLAAFTAALGAMARTYLDPNPSADPAGRTWKWPAIFWTAVAGGVLLKGPFILLFVALVAATLAMVDRSVRWLTDLRPAAGMVGVGAVLLPWVVAISRRSGLQFFTESIGHDTLGKLARIQESHGGPPGYYLVLFFLIFWPGSTLAVLAVPPVFATRRHPAIRFLLAWILPAWLLFEVIATKLPHYILPLFPAMAILIAGCLDSAQLSRTKGLTRVTVLWFLCPTVTCAVGIISLIVVTRDLEMIVWPAAAGAVIFGFLAWRRYAVDGSEQAFLRAAAVSLLLSLTVYGGVLPSLTALFPSASVAEELRETGCEQPRAVVVGYT